MIRDFKETLIAVELNTGEYVTLVKKDGQKIRFELVSTSARLLKTTLKTIQVEEEGGRTDIAFGCVIVVNGKVYSLEREISTQKSFYEPWEIEGIRVWFDAVQDIFNFMNEEHGECRPKKRARFALQETSRQICPLKLHPWCPLPQGGLKIEDCYRGEDCWLGAYNGASAHGGLDINHPPRTPLWAPFDIHDHYYFNSLEMGHNNNRWRGIHRWKDGSEWIIQAHHMTSLIISERTPIQQGQQFAWGAGVLSGAHDHTHFVFKIYDQGDLILLDPWILFWQMYRDMID